MGSNQKYTLKRLVFTTGNLLKKLKLPIFTTNSSTFVKSVERLSKLMLSKMKQYTNEIQTAKLKELGFAPTARIKEVRTVHSKVEVSHDCNFTIGELIEMLPPKIWDDYAQIYWELCIDWDIIGNVWRVVYFHKALMRCYGKELIDALFDMVVRLKEEGVI